MGVQLYRLEMAPLLNKYYWNEVFLRGQNLPLKCCQHLKMLIYFEEMLRFFHTINKGSLGQRATKLPAFKVGGLKKKSAGRPWPYLNQSAQDRSLASSNHSQSLKAGNFAALWPTDPKLSELKDLNPLSTMPKGQESSRILRNSFTT